MKALDQDVENYRALPYGVGTGLNWMDILKNTL
jgi:hypothetical protein